MLRTCRSWWNSLFAWFIHFGTWRAKGLLSHWQEHKLWVWNWREKEVIVFVNANDMRQTGWIPFEKLAFSTMSLHFNFVLWAFPLSCLTSLWIKPVKVEEEEEEDSVMKVRWFPPDVVKDLLLSGWFFLTMPSCHSPSPRCSWMSVLSHHFRLHDPSWVQDHLT